MNFKICFRHLVLLEIICFEKIFITVAQKFVNNLGTKFFSTCYTNFPVVDSFLTSSVNKSQQKRFHFISLEAF